VCQPWIPTVGQSGLQTHSAATDGPQSNWLLGATQHLCETPALPVSECDKAENATHPMWAARGDATLNT